MNITKIEQQRYCVFRSGAGWFGLPALSIVQVAHRPKVTVIPGSHSILCGLAHVRNEFLPVFSFGKITDFDEQEERYENQMLVINGTQGSWGLLIDQTVAVAELETSFSSLNVAEDRWSLVTAGSASYRDHVLQILDPVSLFQFIVCKLDDYWGAAWVSQSESETASIHQSKGAN